MNSSISKANNIRLKILGWYQIIGGVIGLFITFRALAHQEALSGLVLIFIMAAWALYTFSIYAGKLLLTENYKRGLILSEFNQAMQIVSFFIAGYGYTYVSGVMVCFGMKYGNSDWGNGFRMGVNFNIISTWNMSFASDKPYFELSVNFIALYLVYFCYQLQQRIRKEEANAAMVSVGD